MVQIQCISFKVSSYRANDKCPKGGPFVPKCSLLFNFYLVYLVIIYIIHLSPFVLDKILSHKKYIQKGLTFACDFLCNDLDLVKKSLEDVFVHPQ